MAGYGMTDPKAAAAINALANKNNAAAAAKPYTPTVYQPGELAKRQMISSGAKYMPSVNPTAQTSSKTVTNQSSGNDAAKKAMLAWGSAFFEPGAQATGSVQNQFTAQNRYLPTHTGSTWEAYQPGGVFANWANVGSSSSGIGRPSSSIAAGGGGLSGLGALGGLGSFGGGGLGGFGGFGGGSMGGVGDALGGALGGGSGAPPAEEKEKDKPIPQRYWAGGYTAEQQAQLAATGNNAAAAKLKAQFDAENVAKFKGMQGYDDLKKDRAKEAQQLAERTGGQYDSEGNYYARGDLKGIIADENKKRAQQDANYYDVPKGAVPVAANENDKTPPGSKPAAGSGGDSKSGGASGLDNDWLKKLAGMASSWFGGRR